MAIKPVSAPFDPQDFLAKVGTGRSNLKFSANSTVFAQGDRADSIFYLQKGQAKVTVTAPNGKEAVVAILGPGDFVGESCMLGQPLRMAGAIAITDLLAMRIEKSALVAAVHEHVAFAELFIAHLLRRERRVEDDLIDQLFNSAEKRLARTLLLLANFGKEDKSEPVLTNISQDTLAEMVGTTRSRVSHFMTKFRKLGLIDYKDKLTVNSSLLRVVLNDSGRDVHED
jgi:CRP/FNR family transcriptional regulator, cyclic AMP receptor protein